MINALKPITEHKRKPLPRIDPFDCRQAKMILRSLDNRTMQKMIPYLTHIGQNVTEIYIRARMEQSVVSQQLKILRSAHLVSYERRGKEIYYRWNMAKMERLISVVEQLSEMYDERPTVEPEFNPRNHPRLIAVGREI